MPSKDYPSPQEFRSVFGVEAAYDNDWLTYEVVFLCGDDILMNLVFSILTMEVTVKMKCRQTNYLMTELSIDGAIEILVDGDSKKIICRFDSKGFREELILDPSRRPYVKYVRISATGEG